jgi:hypothetical protein
MKVLVLIGAHKDDEDWSKDNRTLAYVYFTRWRRQLKVDPASKEYEAFARAVERRIEERMTHRPDSAFTYAAPTHEQPHRRKMAKPDDPDFLNAIRADDYLWGPGGFGEYIEGYQVLQTDSKIIDK